MTNSHNTHKRQGIRDGHTVNVTDCAVQSYRHLLLYKVFVSDTVSFIALALPQ